MSLKKDFVRGSFFDGELRLKKRKIKSLRIFVVGNTLCKQRGFYAG